MAVTVDVISGFIGAGKTTLINALLRELNGREKVALIENEFGEIGIDGGILGDAGVAVREISGGCICCTLFGNFVRAIRQLIEEYEPERIIIEPTGLGKLSDVMKALETASAACDISLNIVATVVDPERFEFNRTMFGEFFFDQIGETDTLVLSRTQLCDEALIHEVSDALRRINPRAGIYAADWSRESSLLQALRFGSAPILHHEHHHHDCDCGCHHDHHPHDGEHHHHDGEHHHEHHHHHHDPQEEAGIRSLSLRGHDFESVESFRAAIHELENQERYGLIFRAKGYFSTAEKKCWRFDYVYKDLQLHEQPIRHSSALVLIGKDLQESQISAYLCE